jgi:tol-pal system protein YbgF
MMPDMRTRVSSRAVWVAISWLVLCLPVTTFAANRDMERLQIQIATLQTQASDLARMVEDLQKELRRLNETLADQSANFRKAQQDQRAQGEAVLASVKDMTERLGDVAERSQRAAAAAAIPSVYTEAPPATAPGLPPNAAPGTAPLANPPIGANASAPAPRELYSQAYADFARGNYDLAVQGFQEYLRSYPTTDFSDNAQYWIGECQYGKQRYQEAVDSWKILFRDYPASDKLPDAHVKTGMALEKLGRRSQALIEYRFVVDRYPNSPAAKIARDKVNPN